MATLKYWWRRVRPNVVSGLLSFVTRALVRTCRITVLESNQTPADQPLIYCGLHGKSLLFSYHFRMKGIGVLISLSRDGEIQARLFERLGYRVIRGSTGREAVRATIQAIQFLKGGGTMAITPDGPRGPYGQVQMGVILWAQKSGALLVPCGISATKKWTINSWDRHLIPKPFSKAVIMMGDPIKVEAKASEEELEAKRLELETRIKELEQEAEKWVDAQK